MQLHFKALNVFRIIVTLCVVWCSVAQSVSAQCETKLLASDGGLWNYFGYSVSIDGGDTVVVGAIFDDVNGSDSGSAYVSRYDGSAWIEETKLLPTDGAEGDQFGRSAAVDGDVIVVGATYDDDNGVNSGSAYVYRYDGSAWVEEAELMASDGVEYDWLGGSISIDSDVIVVGAYGDDDNNSKSGSAYVFRYDGSAWVEEDKLLASDGDSFHHFGWSVSIDGDVIVVGAMKWWEYMGMYHGAAYVFRYDGSGWVEEAKLLASDGDIDDSFGHSVSIDGNVIVAGAPEDNDRGSDSGSAYVFRYDGSDWIEEAKLLAPDGDRDDFFGKSVSIANDMIVVGAYKDDDNAGSAYVFRYDGFGWNEEVKLLASDGNESALFGNSVSIDGDEIIVGAYHGDDNGSAYVFDLTQCPTLVVSPDPLIAGEYGQFTAMNLEPDTETYLAYSLRGLGSTYVPPLNITLDLGQPVQADNSATSDNDGIATWMIHIPQAGVGRDVWFQACQYELVTNVVATNIE